MLGRNNEFTASGISAEDNMKLNVVRYDSVEGTEKGMYKEAARRVVFNNCMAACEIDHSSIPNFNRHFYYNQSREQQSLQNCYNTRMKLHFGS